MRFKNKSVILAVLRIVFCIVVKMFGFALGLSMKNRKSDSISKTKYYFRNIVLRINIRINPYLLK